MDDLALFSPFLSLIWPKEDDDAPSNQSAIRPLPAPLAEAARETLAAADLGDLQELLSLAAADPFDAYVATISKQQDPYAASGWDAIQSIVSGRASAWPPNAAAYLGDANLSLADQAVRNMLLCAVALALLARALPRIMAAIRSRNGVAEPTSVGQPADWSVAERFPYGDSPLAFRQHVVDARRAIAALLALHHAVQTNTKLAPWLARGLAEVASEEPKRLTAFLREAERLDTSAWQAQQARKRDAIRNEIDSQFAAAGASGSAVYDPFHHQ